MKNQLALNWLIPIIIVLTLIAAGTGLLYRSGSSSAFPFVTVHGETVEIAGEGIYAHDTLFTASLSLGTDFVTMFICLPLLIYSAWIYRQGSLRGGLLLNGVLAYFLYYGASLGLGVAYNSLFLVYIALFSACFYAYILALTAFDLEYLSSRISERFPRRGTAVFMLIVGVGLAFIWLSDVVAALIENRPPAGMGPYTTAVTYTLDVGIIAVACVLSGIQLLRRSPMGYLLSATLNIMLVQIGVMVIGQTAMQLNAGIQLTPGELIGKVTSFVIMGVIAIWLVVMLFRNLSEPKSAPTFRP